MERQLRRRAGIPKKRSTARRAPEPAPNKVPRGPLPLPNLGMTMSATAACVVTVALAVPLVVLPLSAMDEPLV